jgi:hypothetical protein
MLDAGISRTAKSSVQCPVPRDTSASRHIKKNHDMALYFTISPHVLSIRDNSARDERSSTHSNLGLGWRGFIGLEVMA